MMLEAESTKLLLSGFYAAKPAVPRKPPQRFELVGRVVGLNSYRKRAYALSMDNVESELECDPNRFAHKLRDAIHTLRSFAFDVTRNFDGRGREQLVLTDVNEIEGSSDPDA